MRKIFQQSSSIFYNHRNKKQYATKFPLPDARIACPVSPRPSSSAASTFIFTPGPSLQCPTIFYFQFSFEFPLAMSNNFIFSTFIFTPLPSWRCRTFFLNSSKLGQLRNHQRSKSTQGFHKENAALKRESQENIVIGRK